MKDKMSCQSPNLARRLVEDLTYRSVLKSSEAVEMFPVTRRIIYVTLAKNRFILCNWVIAKETIKTSDIENKNKNFALNLGILITKLLNKLEIKDKE